MFSTGCTHIRETARCFAGKVSASQDAILRDRRILCVDDVTRDLEYAVGILKTEGAPYGLHVTATTSTDEALQIYTKAAMAGTPFDAVVFDLSMMRFQDNRTIGINGDRLYQQIAAVSAELGCRLAPVVFFSGSAEGDLQGITWSNACAASRDLRVNVPIRLVLKDDGRDGLLPALAEVLDIAAGQSEQPLRDYICTRLKVTTRERDQPSWIRVSAVRLIRLAIDQGEQCLKMLGRLPQGKEAKVYPLLKAFIEEVQADPRFKTEAMLGDSDQAGVNRHDFLGCLGRLREIVIAPLTDQYLLQHNGKDVPAALCFEVEFFRPYAVKLQAMCGELRALRAQLNNGTALNSLQDVSQSTRIAIRRLLLPQERGEISIPSEPFLVRCASADETNALIWQLLENAVKFSEPGSRRIDVLAKRLDASELPESPTVPCSRPSRAEHWFHLLVRDNGCGIPAESLQQIFRGDFSTSGGGFGLAYVARRLEKLGGCCLVESSVLAPRGTSMHIYLPEAQS